MKSKPNIQVTRISRSRTGKATVSHSTLKWKSTRKRKRGPRSS